MEFLWATGRFASGHCLAEKSATAQICASPAKTLWTAPSGSIGDVCLVGAVASVKRTGECVKDAAR